MENKTYVEISDQYHALKKTLACCDGALERMTAFYRETEAERIVVVGCGSSYSLSCAVANNLRILLGLPCMAVAGGDLMIHLETYRKIFTRKTLLITLSRSGSTHEILYACRELRAAYPLVRILSVVCTERSDLASVSDAVLELPWAFDASVCQTRSVTNMLAAALYLFARLAGHDAMAESLRALAEKGTAFQSKMEPALREIAGRDWTNAMVLCDGETFGAAEEAALAFNEIAYVPSNCKHVLDVRHGPMILVGENTLVLVRLTAAGFEYERALIKDLTAKGASVVVLSDEDLPALDGVAAQYSFGQRLDDAAGAMLILPAAQLSSYYKALDRGLNPDAPEGLDAWIALK